MAMINGPIISRILPIDFWLIAMSQAPPCENVRVRPITVTGPAIPHALLQMGNVQS